jgi:EmrB/QacA subfamily drug resistance transporter
MTDSSHPSAPAELSRREILAVLSGLLLAMLLAGLDQTIVATAGRVIGDDLHGLDRQAWLTTAFLITSTITTLVYGKLSDIFGRKPLFMTAIAIFLLGSLLCGFAPSMPALIVFRALQGVGAGGLMSLAFAITGDIIPARERARYQGYFAGVMAVSAILGPLVGGFFAGSPAFAGTAGWRWAFWFTVPVGVVALALIALRLHAEQVPVRRRVDYTGALLLAVGVVPLLLIGEEGGAWGWLSAGAWWCYVVGAAGMFAFIGWQLHMRGDALLPLDLFTRRTFTVPVLSTFLMGGVQFAATLVVPLYLQIVRGATPTEAGLVLLPMVAGLAATSIVVGRLVRRTGRTKPFIIAGTAVQAAGLICFASVTVSTPLWLVIGEAFVIGIGLGTAGNVILLSIQNSVDFSRLGVASASGAFFRNIGATTGTAVLLSVLFSQATAKIAGAYTQARHDPAFAAAAAAHPGQLTAIEDATAGGLTDSSFLTSVDPRLAEPFLTGFTTAIRSTSWIAVGIATAGILLALIVEEIPLRTVSGQAAARAMQATTATPAA